jgi:THO complex subunit 2
LEELSAVLVGALACLVGSGKIRLNQPLYMTLCGLYRSKLTIMKQNEDDSFREVDESSIDANTFAVLSSFLLPSLSLFPSDPSLSRELWSVVQLLPYTVRYKLYASWRSPSLEKGALRSMTAQDVKACNFPKPLHCIESEIQTGIETRSIVKRLSKKNIQNNGPDLSKVSHNNPLVVFSYILNQIESYDNMILMMVDTFQFVTALGLDVIGYCLLMSLGGGDDGSGKRSRTKCK